MLVILMTLVGAAMVFVSLVTKEHFPKQSGMLLMLFIGIVLLGIGFSVWGKHGSPFPWMWDEKETAKLKSKRRLKKAALNGLESKTRECALKKLNDAAVYAVAAEKEVNESNRLLAVENTVDQEVLYRVAQKDFRESIRRVALSRIENRALLVGIAREKNSKEIRLAAANKVNDPALYFELAKKDAEIGEQAAARVEDQQLLSNIIFQGKFPAAKKAALSNLKVPERLEQVALKSADKELRCAAVQKLPGDTPLLVQLAENVQEAPAVRAAAMGRVQDLSVCERAAQEKSTEETVRTAAVRRVWDFKLLQKVLAGAEGEFRKTVIVRMLEVGCTMSGLMPEEFLSIPAMELPKEHRAKYLEKAVSMSKEHPELLLSIRNDAKSMILSSHTDTRHRLNGHNDHTFYSDCTHHFDNGRWQHEDDNRLERFKKDFAE